MIITILVSLICKSQESLNSTLVLTHFTYDLFLLIPVHLVMTETEIKKSIFRTSIDDKQIALNEFRWKEGPAQNEIFSKLKVGPFLTDNMILGCKLYKNQSRLQGL